jgi:hypothetical protein
MCIELKLALSYLLVKAFQGPTGERQAGVEALLYILTAIVKDIADQLTLW